VPIALAVNMPLVRKNENSVVEMKCAPTIEEPLDGSRPVKVVVVDARGRGKRAAVPPSHVTRRSTRGTNQH
jgi:hypothetical protein